jgi:hypothetical protein
MRLWKRQKCKINIRGRRLRQQLRGRKRIKGLGVRLQLCLRKKRTANDIEGWSAGQRSHLGIGGTPSKHPYEIFGGVIAKQVVGTSSGLRKMKEWTLWRG